MMRVGLMTSCLLLLLAGHAAAQPLSRQQAYARAHALGELGRALFADPSLSASGKLACASCHSPAHAFGPPNGLPVQLGGADGRQPGVRAVPSLMYLQAVPQFTEHYFESDDEGDESVDNGPTGGLTWDGRADTAGAQARIPLLSPYEMANPTPADVVAKVARAPYATDFRALFGDTIFTDEPAAFAAIVKALEVYQQDPAVFYPYASKYDAYLAGRAQLTAQESNGLALFNDPDKGNCAQCHISKPGRDGSAPQFTDYGLIALGAPRNPAIPANADPAYYDLGLCGPYRTDLSDHPDYCGRFRTPTLRNVATRQTFFHNGVFHSLKDVMRFYVERDTTPARWYPGAKYNDLPAAYQKNIDTEDAPLDRHPGMAPALTDPEIDDIIAFLATLTDRTP